MIYIERTEVELDKAPLVLWDNLLTGGTLTASTEESGAEVENITTGSTFDYWTPTTTSGAVYLDTGTPKTASALGIAAHNLGSLGATITVKDASGPTTLATVSPTDDKTILILFDETSTSDWEIEITGASAAFSIGVMTLGEPLIFETGITPSYTPLWMAENIELFNNKSLGGQFFQNRIVRKSSEGIVNLNILDRDFVEGISFQDFRDYYNEGKTFFWAAGPSVFDKDVSFCRRVGGGELRPSFPENGLFYRASLNMEAYIG